MASRIAKKRPRLWCFVAMAVGQPDTDALYRRKIVPTLRALNIEPRRVDMINHNRDIDDKILEELGACDLALADLTFARPSVYFEAGYAQRQVPVVYTARKDHLSAGADDNRRVHFDLQMRNIVPWKDEHDTTFARRLRSRMVLVTQGLVRQRLTEAARRSTEERFQRLSLIDRETAIFTAAVNELIRARFRPGAEDDNVVHGLPKVAARLSWARWNAPRQAPYTRAVCAVGRATVEVTLVVANVRARGGLRSWAEWWDSRYLHTRSLLPNTSAFRAHLCICAMTGLRPSIVQAAFPRYSPSPDGTVLVNLLRPRDAVDRLRNKGVSEKRIHVLATVRSERDFRQRFRVMLDRVKQWTGKSR